MTLPTDIRLSGAPNFRDLGGYPARDGQTLRRGILYRSGELSELTAGDIQTVRQLGIRTVIDIRAAEESKSKPDRLPEGLNVIHLPIHSGVDDPTRLKSIRTFARRDFDVEAFTRQFYHRIAFDHRTQIGQIIGQMSRTENLPAIVHCTGGKDRTGVVSALIQLFAGVSMENVMKDYLMTNERMISVFTEYARKYRWLKLFGVSIEKFTPLAESRSEYLATVLKDIFSDYSTPDRYFQEGCGVAPDTLERFKSLLLVEE